MKKLLLAILTILFAASIASALHLTCDPQDATEVTKYKIELNGEAVPAEIEKVGESQVRLIYNVDHLTNGEYRAIAAAGNDRGKWSVWSDVFKFCIGVSAPKELFLCCAVEEPKRISQFGWKVSYVSSEEPGLFGSLAIDGDIDTQWETVWTSADPVITHPHEIHIDLGRMHTLQGFFYLPRQDSNWNGCIKSYIFYVSNDETNWQEVASGSFIETKDEQFVEFNACSARYVSLVSLSEINGKQWATMAEFNLWGN